MNRKATPQQPSKKGKADSTPAEEEQLPETGFDTFSLPNGTKYVGEWKRFETGLKRHGHGVYTGEDFVYVGEFEEDLFNGQGEIKYNDGSSYKGDFRKGTITGKGKLIFADGSSYVGQFRDGKMHGLGTFRTIYGEQWRGMWNNGLSAASIFPQAPPEPVYEEEEEEAFFEEEEDMGIYGMEEGMGEQAAEVYDSDPNVVM